MKSTNKKTSKTFGIKLVTILIISLGLMTACAPPKSPEEVGATDPELLRESVKVLTEVMVNDIFSPPVASRVYVYSSVAAYEAVALNNDDYNSLAGQVHELTEGPKAGENVNLEIAGLHAFLTTGEELIFTTDEISMYRDSLYQDFLDKGLSKKVLNASKEYGQQVADHIISWANKDNYKETRGTQKYVVTDEPGRWVPTPPQYMDAIEPNWDKIRTMVLESPDQFKPVPPVPFSMEKGSEFYKQVMAVYDAVEKAESEHIAIAKFWDCNPFATRVKGHFMFAIKKITPGGHWMGITSIVTRDNEDDFAKTAAAYAETSIALFDAFISSWDEKFRSNLIRPETVINKYIDADWAPLLQTPPFPEYTSGHSTISRAAAEVLTKIYGPEVYFEDTTELDYGLPVRSFNSFIEASDEAAISRIYGGIHYPMAATHGITQGEGVGKFVADNLILSK